MCFCFFFLLLFIIDTVSHLRQCWATCVCVGVSISSPNIETTESGSVLVSALGWDTCMLLSLISSVPESQSNLFALTRNWTQLQANTLSPSLSISRRLFIAIYTTICVFDCVFIYPAWGIGIGIPVKPMRVCVSLFDFAQIVWIRQNRIIFMVRYLIFIIAHIYDTVQCLENCAERKCWAIYLSRSRCVSLALC